MRYRFLLYGFQESCILIRLRAILKNRYSDRDLYISVFGPGFFPVFLIVLFTACSICCMKTLCVKNNVLSCSTFLYSNYRRHLNKKCHTVTLTLKMTASHIINSLLTYLACTDLMFGQ